MKFNWIMGVILVLGSSALAADPVAPKEGPCKEIKEACEAAGFIKGEAKEGKGLWLDCIDPIMQGTTAKKSKLPLPSVSADLVASCKQKHPKFGSGKVAN